MPDDRDLDAAFRALRAADAKRRPALTALLARRPPARPPFSAARAAALALVLAGLAAGTAALLRRDPAPRPAPPDLWAWRSPTRSLLVSGAGVDGLPRLGETWGAPAPPPRQEEPR